MTRGIRTQALLVIMPTGRRPLSVNGTVNLLGIRVYKVRVGMMNPELIWYQ